MLEESAKKHRHIVITMIASKAKFMIPVSLSIVLTSPDYSWVYVALWALSGGVTNFSHFALELRALFMSN